MTRSDTAKWAARYCELGLAITWTPRGQKGPRHVGWNLPENAITQRRWPWSTGQRIHPMASPRSWHLPAWCRSTWTTKRCARDVLEKLGVNLSLLRELSPCIVGRQYQLIFAAPDMPLKHRSVTWPKEDNPRASSVLFEFRAGTITATLPRRFTQGPGNRIAGRIHRGRASRRSPRASSSFGWTGLVPNTAPLRSVLGTAS